MTARLGLAVATLFLASCGVVDAVEDLIRGKEDQTTPKPDKADKDSTGAAGGDGSESVGDATPAGTSSAGGGDATVWIVNESDTVACYVFIADSAGNASDDLLGSDVLEPGTYLEVTGVDAAGHAFVAYPCEGDGFWWGEATGAEYTWFLTGNPAGDDGWGDTGLGPFDTGI